MPRSPRLLLWPIAGLSALALTLPPAPALADPLVRPALATDSALASRLAGVLTTSRVTKASVGVVVADSASGTQLYGRLATRALTPASNMKLVTAAAALDLLGPTHTFSTTVHAATAPVAGAVSRLPLVVVVENSTGVRQTGEYTLTVSP